MESNSRHSLARSLALNRTVGVVLVAVLFFGLGEELWTPFFPIYLKASPGHVAQSPETVGWTSLITIGIYAFLRNLFEGICYIGGGQLTSRIGDKGSLLFFALLTISGYFLFLAIPTAAAAIVASLLILGWEPLSVPVTFTTVGSTVSSAGQGMAFAIQSIQKRLPKILGPAIAGYVLSVAVSRAGTVDDGTRLGMRWLVGAALVLGLTSLAIQLRWMPKRKTVTSSLSAVQIVRQLHPTLRTLLLAEVFTRWCDWLVREFVILYIIFVRGVPIREAGLLLSLQHVVALLTYLPVGRMTKTVGLQPFIGVTFVFFALFPLVLALVPGGKWLILAFVTYGLREIGEPARKALITSLLPEPVRARGVGLYWGIRSFAICTAPPVGAVVWYYWDPQALLYLAFALGCLGGGIYFVFSRQPYMEQSSPIN